MDPRKLLPLLLIALATRSSALDESGKKAGEALIASFKEDLKILTENDPEGNRGYNLKQSFRQFQSTLANGSNRQILQLIENISSNGASEKTQQCLMELKKTIGEEQKRKATETIARLENYLKTTRETLLAAKSPAELDGILDELSKKEYLNFEDRDGDDSSSSQIRKLAEQVSTTKQFVTQWQDYLQAKTSGNTARMIQSLQNISQQQNLLIPRSQILALMDQERGSIEDAAKILDEIKTLDDIGDALKKLAAIQQASRYSDSGISQISEQIQILVKLEKTYRDFLSGLPVNLEVFNANYDSSSFIGKSSFTRLKADLLILVLPRCLGIPEVSKANENESVDEFLTRITAEAKARGDSSASQRIREIQQTLSRSNRISGDDTAALRYYAAGQNQLAARQYMLAVVSYQSALKAGSDLIPAGRIGELLEKIQKEHPEEYKQGMTEFLTPKPMMDDPGMYYRGMNPRMMPYMGGNPNMPSTTTSVVLPVPAKETPEPPKAEEKTTAPTPKPTE